MFSVAHGKFSCNTKTHKKFADSIDLIIGQKLSVLAETVNIISPEPSSCIFRDFKDDLLSSTFKSTSVLFRQGIMSAIKIDKRRGLKRCSIFLIESFTDFVGIYTKVSNEFFKPNGFYLVVLISGIIPEIDKIFELMLEKQMFNVEAVFEDEDHRVVFKSFMPFKAGSCNQVKPIITKAVDPSTNSLSSEVKKIFPNKLRNLHGCPIRISISNDSEPFIFATRLNNGSYKLSGGDITLINALAENLNFKINYTYIGPEGVFFDNGTTYGPLKALKDGYADLSVSNWWLTPKRLDYFDSTGPYIIEPILLLVPPGQYFTTIEKLLFPFSLVSWISISICFIVGFLVIWIAKCQPRSIQNFVFGTGVRYPFLNMFIGCIGGTQRVLPRRNFARVLLMIFLLFSLVIRTLYQASFYQLLRSNQQHNPILTIDDVIKQEFKFYTSQQTYQIYQVSEAIKSR